MTNTHEVSLVKWLNGQYDDADTSLLVQNFDPDNLLANLNMVDNIIVMPKEIETCWSEFCQIVGLENV